MTASKPILSLEFSPKARQIFGGMAKRRKVNRKEKTPYQIFLKGEDWKENLRIACFAAHARNKKTFCYTCGRPGEIDQLRIHHLQYANEVEGPLDPFVHLVPLCTRCHAKVHAPQNCLLQRSKMTKEKLREQLQLAFIREKESKQSDWNQYHKLSPRGKRRNRNVKKFQAWLIKHDARPTIANYHTFALEEEGIVERS